MAMTGPLGAPAEEDTPARSKTSVTQSAVPRTDQPHDPNRIEHPMTSPTPKLPRRPQPAEDGTAPRLEMSVEVLRERYEAGESVPKIAEGMGLTPRQVYAWMRHERINRRPPGAPDWERFPIDLAELREWYEAGESIRGLAKALRVSGTAVKMRLAQAGATLRSREKPHRPRMVLPVPSPVLRKRYEAGESLYDLAAELGVATGTVKIRLLEAGTTMRPVGGQPRAPQAALPIPPQQLLQRHQAGESLHDLALELGMPRNTLRGQLEAAGKAHPPPTTPSSAPLPPSPTGDTTGSPDRRPEHGSEPAKPPHPAPDTTLPPMNPPALYTPAQVAALLGVDITTVARWAQKGKLSAVKTPGGHHRYPAREVDALRNGLQTSSPAPAQPASSPREGTARNPIQALVDDHYGGAPLPALLELADRYGIAIAYLDREWFTQFVHRGLTDDEWKRIAAELDDFCAVLDDICADELHDYAIQVLRAAHVPTTPGEDK